METQRLFDYKNKQVITEYEPAKVEELIATGDYKKLDIPKLTELESKAEGIYASYKKEVERVRNSDNPLMTDDVKRYELAKLEKEMREKSEQVEQEWNEYRAQQQAEAKTRAARATVKVSENDKLTAEQFVTRASLSLASSYDDDKGAILDGIINDIALLTDEQRVAMQSQVNSLMDGLEAKDKRRLVQAVQDVRNEDLLALNVASQLPVSVTTALRRHDALRDVRL